MPFLTSVGRALPAATLFVAFAAAQTCFYPDGQTVSTDIPCNSTASVSSCCSADSFCMDNGLCFGDGMVSRGSCTDKTWGSPACAGYCKTEDPGASIAITPCASTSETNVFVCGLNSTDCQTDTNTFTMAGGSGLLLRPSQIAALVAPALEASQAASASATPTACPSQPANPAADPTKIFTAGQMAGVGCGVGVPLLLALCAALYLLSREKRKYAKPKLMYKLPDDVKDEFTWRPPPAAHLASRPTLSSRNTVGSEINSTNPSTRQSLRTVASGKPAHMGNFLERYEAMKKKGDVQGPPQRHELDSANPFEDVERHELGEALRHELGDHRVSR